MGGYVLLCTSPRFCWWGAMHQPGISCYVCLSAMADSTCLDVHKSGMGRTSVFFFLVDKPHWTSPGFLDAPVPCIEGVKSLTWKLPFRYTGWMKPWMSLSWNASTKDKGGCNCAGAMVTAMVPGVVNLTGLKAWWAWGILLLLSVVLTDGGMVTWVYAWTAWEIWMWVSVLNSTVRV